MTVTVPAHDAKNIAKATEVAAIAASIAASPAGTHKDALQQRQQLVNRELVVDLMATGHLSPLTILSTCTYNT